MVKHSRYRIFLVEDDADDRFVMQKAFAELNLSDTLTVFPTSDHFYRFVTSVKDHQQLPTLIVLDFNMPVINGGELLLRIKREAHLAHIPVVIYSTGMRPVLEETLMAYGALRCFNKGMAYEDFLQMARTFCLLAQGSEVVC